MPAAPKDRLIIALDFPELRPALDLARRIGPQVGLLKVGLELFNAEGPAAIRRLRSLGAGIFYDAKLCDIPNTVAGAASAAAKLGLSMLNVHALGGKAMMAAAKEASATSAQAAGFPPPLVIAVTILTSLSDDDVHALGLRDPTRDSALRLALLAKEAGLDGVVCSVHEVQTVKEMCGSDFLTVTPGIRPIGADAGDQSRVATPRYAREVGADYLVVGRPVTRAADPAQAVADILAELA